MNPLKKILKMSKLTVLSFGGGQDSTALLYKIIYDKAFDYKYVKDNDLLVVMADTGNEHDETNAHVEEVRELCRDHNISFWFLTGNMGYTSPVWSKGLVDFYESGNRIGSKAFPKTCTDKLKITPIYNFLEEYVHNVYGTSVVGRKRAIKEFVANHGKIDVIIGIAAGEEKRASSNDESPSVWMRDCINKVYPLIDLGMDRQACQDYIEEVGHVVPPPSNCILCPFMSYQELLYMYRVMPKWYNKWVELEANKIKANSHIDPKKNMGVWGNKLLPEALKIAEKKHGQMTVAELKEYKMSHGHCVKSKY
jgi:3'-phosphoadenosine 5'-phosphosulfate sulfotransferase (PAPS reductase)/FAD synthetase